MIDIQGMSYLGVQVGLGIAVVPAAVTTLIACSRILLVNIIADIAVRILTANSYSMAVHGVSFVAVPFLWKMSLIAAMLGGTIVALSLIAILANTIYQRYAAGTQENS